MEMTENTRSSSGHKWLVGLGIGCGGIVVIVIVLIVGGFFFVRNLTQGFRESGVLAKNLTDRYGQIEEYCPEPDGTISAARLEVFLAVRDAELPARRALEASLETVTKARADLDTRQGGLRDIFTMVRTGASTVPEIAGFLKARNQALLDHGMGLGEYSYLYAIAYAAWLKKPPEDGPGFRMTGPGGVAYDRDSLEGSKNLMRGRVHRLILAMMWNQQAKLQAGLQTGTPRAAAGAEGSWANALLAEIKTMETNGLRVPWEDGLPDVIARTLGPYRARLEASYSRLTNPFEIAVQMRSR